MTLVLVILMMVILMIPVTSSLEKPDAKEMITLSSFNDSAATDAKDRYECETGALLKVNGKNYTILDHAGSGGVATVCKVNDSLTGEIFAVKVFTKNVTNLSTESEEMSEIEVLRMFEDVPGIVQLIDWESTPDKILIVMEYMHCSIFELKTEVYERIVEVTPAYIIRYLAENILMSLAEIHAKGVVHLDLKTMNVMVTEDLKIKLIDFGSSLKTDKEVKRNMFRNKAAAPEALREKDLLCELDVNACKLDTDKKGRVGFAADVWSFGVILYEMMYGYGPYDKFYIDLLLSLVGDVDDIAKTLISAITNLGTNEFKIKFPPYKDTLLEQMVKDCLQGEQDLRPTVNELLQRLLRRQI